ncbi:MAG: tetratricopeptide repeat protein [Deltaproteobacteria bacterium]|nr:tetratricopeptide repeat protein [Deltaproteobacteria bacterium]
MTRALAIGLLVGCALSGVPLRAARAAEPVELKTLIEKALNEIEAWDTEGATRALEELLAQYPEAPETAWIRGKVLFEQGRYREAVAAFEDAKKKSGGTSPVLEADRKLAEAALDETMNGAVLESAHFVAIAKDPKDKLLLPWAIDGLEAAYAALTKDLGYEPPTKVRLEVYDSPKALAHVSTLTVAEIKASGTIALCKYNRLMVTTPRALLRGYPWMDTLAHEFTHFLVTKKGHNKVPIWLQEGLAKFLETRWRGPPGLAIDEFQAVLLEKAAKAKDLITFAQMYPSMAKLPTQEKTALAFAEVESAMRMLYARGGQQALTELVAAMAAGFSDEAAVAQAYGKSFAQFEADWHAEILKPRVKRPAVAAPEKKLVFKDDAKAKDESPVPQLKESRAQSAARLGNLFFERQRWQPAALEYGKARTLLREEDPVLGRRYAFAQLKLKKPIEASEALSRVVERDPGDAAAQVLYGQALFLLQQYPESKKAYLAAIALDPFDPVLQTGLHELGQATKDAGLIERSTDAIYLLAGRERPAPAQADAGVQ